MDTKEAARGPSTKAIKITRTPRCEVGERDVYWWSTSQQRFRHWGTVDRVWLAHSINAALKSGEIDAHSVGVLLG